MINPGDVLRVKTTGENVVVIDEGPDKDYLVVRRPMNNQAEGIKHVEEEFLPVELETVEQNIAREYNDIKIRQALLRQEQAQEPIREVVQ